MQPQVLNGNELLIQGGKEAGFALYTGYPGSPLADFFNILYKEKAAFNEKGIKVVIANSEANAAAMASGAKMAGKDCLVAMKSMGLHVAADALSVGNFADPGFEKEDGSKSGVVIAVGDDPWSISTSAPVDSRYLFKHLHMPFLEPSTPQELKDWMKHALSISQKSSVYCGVLLTTFMAEGGGRVEVREDKLSEVAKETIDTTKFDLSKNVMVPPNSLKADVRMLKERFPRVSEALEELDLDEQLGSNTSSIGFLSSGLTFETLKHVLEEKNIIHQVSLYKLACPYPLNEKKLVPFLKRIKSLVIVEEKRGFIENEVIELASKLGIHIKIVGKKFDDQEGFPAHGGLNFEIISRKVESLAQQFGIEANNQEISSLSLGLDLPKRLPTFCPGCPHRETLSLMKELRKTLSKKNINLLSHGDVGCYSLAFLEPFKEMHDLSAMGQGGAMASGNDLFATNPSIVLMGDSTFFHSGMSALSHSIQCGHNITYILLDNDNTDMTGQQMTPASGVSVDGQSRPRQKMAKVAKSLGVADVIEVNPSDRYFYKNILSDYIQKPGTKVIVSNKECGLTYQSKVKAKERESLGIGKTLKTKEFFQINPFACEDCRVCVDMTGCPGLTQTHDAYGTKVAIDPGICVADSYCTKLKACPSFEKVSVANYHPTKYQERKNTIHDKLEEPTSKKSLDQIAKGDDYRLIVIGVGGSGVTTISKVIAGAAKKMDDRSDLDFKFVEQKGLAQRNGSVTGHISLFKKGRSHTATIPKGSADVVLSPDLLEGARAVSYLSMAGEMVVDENFQMPLSILLDRGQEKAPINEKDIRLSLDSNLESRCSQAAFKKISYERFGKSVYASAMLLGFAFQKGLIPFSKKSLKESFKESVPGGEFENNWNAFTLGREMASSKKNYLTEHKRDGVGFFIKSLKLSVAPWESADKIIKRYKKSLEIYKQALPMINEEFLAHYLHDLYLYDRGDKVKKVMKNIKKLKELYPDELFSMAVRTLVKTYWIKDEVMVSHLMRLSTTHQFYKSIGSSYKVKRINRPHFDLLGMKIEFDISPKEWMLKMMSYLRVLRKILPTWHKKERKIAKKIRNKLLEAKLSYSELKALENIKGYREVRYESYESVFGESL